MDAQQQQQQQQSSAAAETGVPRTRSPSRVPRGSGVPTPPACPAPGAKVHGLKELEKVVKSVWDSHQAQGCRLEAVIDVGKLRKYPHVRTSAVSFEHHTSFRFSDDSSEDDDGEDVAYDFPYTLEVNGQCGGRA